LTLFGSAPPDGAIEPRPIAALHTIHGRAIVAGVAGPGTTTGDRPHARG